DVVRAPDGLWVTTFRDARILHVDANGAISVVAAALGFEQFGFDAGEALDAGQGGTGGGSAGGAGGGSGSFGTEQFTSRVAWRMVPSGSGAVIAQQRAQLTAVASGGFGGCSVGYGGGSFGIVHAAGTQLTE